MCQANGDAIILMMSDFQDPIDLIPQYIQQWEKGHKVVMAQKDSSDENFLIHSNLYHPFDSRRQYLLG